MDCDETSPRCQRCVKRQIPCSFLEDAPEGFSATPTNLSIHDTSTSTPKSLDYQPSDPEQPLPGVLPPSRPRSTIFATGRDAATDIQRFDLLDLELVQFYSTRTYMTMSSRLSTHVVWRDTVFTEALRHDFLLHGLMATAALHKATMQSKTSEAYAEYSKLALAHQNAALAAYIPAVSKPNQDNGIALFCLSLFLSIWAFASKRLPEGLNSVKLELNQGDSPGVTLPLHSPTAEFIEIVMILRGVYAVIRETDTWLQGDIEELLRYPQPGDLPPHSADVVEAFELLAEAVDDPKVTHMLEGKDASTSKTLYLEHLQRLRDITRCRSVVEWDGHIFSWFIMAPAPFIQSLKRGEPWSLVLFAHWAGTFRCMDHHWWAIGWAYRLVVDISSLLDPAWAPYLEWPKRQIGLVFQDNTLFDGRRAA
ncbi:hypothetical protein LTR92_003086 [Exophiala xenobiotica]|nr:hypothetical protein LTR92_003086 [Exophiala xenobiotica]